MCHPAKLHCFRCPRERPRRRRSWSSSVDATSEDTLVAARRTESCERLREKACAAGPEALFEHYAAHLARQLAAPSAPHSNFLAGLAPSRLVTVRRSCARCLARHELARGRVALGAHDAQTLRQPTLRCSPSQRRRAVSLSDGLWGAPAHACTARLRRPLAFTRLRA